jgi:Nif-specific regulatory protein
VELFGCEKGAFTGATARRTGRFETAQGGSIFLDEIGELPLELQSKLLRVIEDRTFERVGSSDSMRADVRVIAATNRNLSEEVRKGNFREDLYWRLNVVPLVMPPLRDRKSDIPLLVGYFAEKFNRAYSKDVRVSGEAMENFMEYRWPGNVRELANVLERLIIMCEGDEIGPGDLPYGIKHNAGQPAGEVSPGPDAESLKSEVLNLERDRIVRALKESDYVQSRAARLLGITPRQLGYRIKKYRIETPR